MLQKSAKERVEYELMKLFGGEWAHSALLKLDECNLLEYIFPFVKRISIRFQRKRDRS